MTFLLVIKDSLILSDFSKLLRYVLFLYVYILKKPIISISYSMYRLKHHLVWPDCLTSALAIQLRINDVQFQFKKDAYLTL